MIFTPDNWPADYTEFVPRPWLRNGHLQTIVGNFLPRRNPLPKPSVQLVEVSPAHGTQISTQVLCECHWQPLPERASRLTVLILHGLEGSSHSQYVIGNAAKLFHAGCNVIRMNMRNCGGPSMGPGIPDMAALTPTLYHSGLSNDVDRVLRHFLAAESLQSIALLGYSMGGNLVLKLAGELGRNAPPQLRSVVGVSPAADLAISADALHETTNRLYERKFLRALLQRFRRKAVLFPRAFDPQRAAGITSLRDFDDRITALYSGFRGADDYYYRAAAARLLPSIAVPTLLLHSSDDPFVRFTPETRAAIADNPCITLLETTYGGHCAFLATPARGDHPNDGYWAEYTALSFLLAHR
jgi:predicted alpha/beta-fold hydrolase